MDDDEREHAALVRQESLDRLVQIVTELAERERANPGSVPDVAVTALHMQVSSWCRMLRLGVRP